MGILAAIILSAALIFAPNIYADDACTVAGENDPLVCGTPGSDEELRLIATVKNILDTVYLWIGIVTVVFIIVGGISYMTSSGDPQKIERAKKTIIYSICGLIVTLAAFAITSFAIGALQGQTSGQGYTADDPGNPFGKNRNKVKAIAAIDRTTLVAGQKITIKAHVIPDYATNKTLSFKSSDPMVASINSKGELSAHRAGELVVTITSPDGPTKEIPITVRKPIPVTSIRLSQTEVTMKKNKTVTVKATPLPANATDKTLVWASKDPKIATVDQSGTIKSIKSDAETVVTVTARNMQVFALNKSPNKITLADVAPEEKLPKVVAKIKVIVESEYYACTTSTANKNFSGNLEIRAITKKFITPANKDFTYGDEGSVISRKGGYTSYVKNLGGIFAMYPGKSKKFKVKSACDFQAAAEYAFGLWTVWGVDYDNGSNYHDWGGSTSDQSDAFWKGSGSRYAGAGYAYKDIDTNLSDDDFKHRRRTNCNYACDALVRKTNLFFDKNLCSRFEFTARISKVGKIRDTAKLQVGDMVHYFRDGDWKHVAVVGEVYKDYVILYDGGGRFIETKQYKKKVKRGRSMINGTTYDSYDDWYAVRVWNIDQSKVLEGLK